ncbi:unnamed protein product [Amoebophrya sp. A120]|nr:unnamed protein product [Amoebophrya sp. A120]|eukprot:GSA120T00009917001.1
MDIRHDHCVVRTHDVITVGKRIRSVHSMRDRMRVVCVLRAFSSATPKPVEVYNVPNESTEFMHLHRCIAKVHLHLVLKQVLCTSSSDHHLDHLLASKRDQNSKDLHRGTSDQRSSDK